MKWMDGGKLHGKDRERKRERQESTEVFVFGLGFMFIYRMHTHSLKTQIVLNGNPMSQYTSDTATFVVSSSNHLHISKYENNAIFVLT